MFRAVATVETVLAFAQAVLAGGFLAGHYDLLGLHSANGQFTGIAAVAQLVAAILLWRPGRGPGWPALACTGLFAAIAAQIALGHARALAIHIPLGVTIVLGSALMLIWAWRPARGRDARR